MSNKDKAAIGSITWVDLTVPNAEQVKEFYSRVVGWTPKEFDMGGYTDYNMNSPENGETVAGICHARGLNANLPPQWLIYITVENIEESVERCTRLGGKIISPPRHDKGYGTFCVIQDPAGAVAALFQPEG